MPYSLSFQESLLYFPEEEDEELVFSCFNCPLPTVDYHGAKLLLSTRQETSTKHYTPKGCLLVLCPESERRINSAAAHLQIIVPSFQPYSSWLNNSHHCKTTPHYHHPHMSTMAVYIAQILFHVGWWVLVASIASLSLPLPACLHGWMRRQHGTAFL